MTQPDRTVYVEPSFRAFHEWTPTLLRGAELIADGGTLRAAADLCDAMLADDRLLGVLNKRVHGVLGLPITFEPAKGRKRPVKALEADEDWWACFTEEELGEVAKWGFLLGVGLGELVWTDRGGRVVCALKSWHPRHLRFDWQARQWMLRVEDGREIVITPGDGKWVLFTPYGRKRPWAKGLWRALSRWWLLKQYAVLDWATYSERHGQGVFAATPTGQGMPGREDRKQLAADLKGIGRATTIALPPGYDLKLIEATANNWQTFEAQKTATDLAFAVLVLGQNLTTEVTGGSFAATDAHRNIEQGVLRFTAETLATFTHDQSLVWWAEFNFGSSELAPWPHWAAEPPEDLKASADLFVSFGDALDRFARFKIPVDVAALCQRFNVPLVEGAEIPPLEAPPPAPFVGGLGDGTERASKKPAKARQKGKRGPRRVGLVEGQLYADSLADAARDRARDALEPNVSAVLDAIRGGESYDDVRKRLAKAYVNMDARKLAKIAGATMTLAQLAGRYAMKQDTAA